MEETITLLLKNPQTKENITKLLTKTVTENSNLITQYSNTKTNTNSPVSTKTGKTKTPKQA